MEQLTHGPKFPSIERVREGRGQVKSGRDMEMSRFLQPRAPPTRKHGNIQCIVHPHAIVARDGESVSAMQRPDAHVVRRQ